MKNINLRSGIYAGVRYSIFQLIAGPDFFYSTTDFDFQKDWIDDDYGVYNYKYNFKNTQYFNARVALRLYLNENYYLQTETIFGNGTVFQTKFNISF
jgi:hypothetical protein